MRPEAASCMTTRTRRMTPQRTAILAELRTAIDHPTAAELHRRLRQHLPRLSLGTVYRNLDVLAGQGHVTRLVSRDAQTRYDGMPATHDHVRCLGCGVIVDIPEVLLADTPTLPEGFVVDLRQLEFLGTCADCRAAERSRTLPALEQP